MILLKRNKKLTYLFLGLLVILLLFRYTGVLKNYTIVTNTMEPNIEEGANVLSTNLLKTELDELVVLNNYDSLLGPQVYVFRLIGKGGDTVRIKKGVVYRNGLRLKGITTAHDFKVSKNQYYSLEEKKQILSDSGLKKVVGDSVIIALADEVAEKLNLNDNRHVAPENYSDDYIKEIYSTNWNKDFFGPLVIPKGEIFVLGDNRDNANDSRFIGLIKEDQILGTVILHW